MLIHALSTGYAKLLLLVSTSPVPRPAMTLLTNLFTVGPFHPDPYPFVNWVTDLLFIHRIFLVLPEGTVM